MLEDTRSLVDLLWEREVDHEPLTDPDRRASFRKRIRALVNQIANGDVKEEYRNEFDRRMEAMFGTPARKSGRGEWQGGRRKINQGASLSLKKRMGGQMDKASMRQAIPNPNGRSLLLALIEYPDLIDELIEEIALISFGALDNLRDAVLDACSLGPAVSSSELQAELLSRGFAQDLKRLEGNRGPMRASIGGADASVSVKVGAWRRLCSVYMRQSGSQEQRNELRALAERKITENDSESVRSISEAYRRENAKDETE